MNIADQGIAAFVNRFDALISFRAEQLTRGGNVGGGTSIGINGITGTLGAGATLLALAMGATCILGLGRNRDINLALPRRAHFQPARVHAPRGRRPGRIRFGRDLTLLPLNAHCRVEAGAA